jgi:hypothetical protein
LCRNKKSQVSGTGTRPLWQHRSNYYLKKRKSRNNVRTPGK